MAEIAIQTDVRQLVFLCEFDIRRESNSKLKVARHPDRDSDQGKRNAGDHAGGRRGMIGEKVLGNACDNHQTVGKVHCPERPLGCPSSPQRSGMSHADELGHALNRQ